MIPQIAVWLASNFINSVTGGFKALDSAMPDWLMYGLQNMFASASTWDLYLPMYAHPGMKGLAGITGLLPMLGFVLLLTSTLVIIAFILVVVWLFIRLIPWNTQ